MKRPIIFLLLLLTAYSGFGQSKTEIKIIPEPVAIVRTQGEFTLPKDVFIQAPSSPELVQTVAFLRKRLSDPTGYRVISGTASSNANIILEINRQTDSKIGDEGYNLTVTPGLVKIRANKAAGLFYGVQSLLQLFPAEIESNVQVKGVAWKIPAVEITDYPKLGWRGLMFDAARHWFTKEEVKQYIDAMVRYKYNILHLHLTDDEGWRIEIKGLPKLTEVGAWRIKREGNFGVFSPPMPNEPKNYGGFYTQDDIRELVKYAQERFVNIMPEIDVPGHSLAAIASYPELSCTPEAVNYNVRYGERIMDWSQGAPPIALLDNTLCPANEKVYEFLDQVITQVADLFPFPYIHMGGDEAPINYWQTNAQVKALMQREGMTKIQQVQGYFTRRVEKIVESKGKKFMGWDEILEGGVSPTTAVMSWRGMKYGIEAAHDKHEVVMSPTDFAYIDYMQGDEISEPKVYASLRLNKTYQFEPIPDGVDPKYIKGGQANLWTEQISNIRQAEYMTWPRGMAIAEAVWSPKGRKDWPNFVGRVEEHFKRFDIAETKYSPAVFDPIFKASKTPDNRLKIELSTEMKGLDIYYSFDNSEPDRFYPKYTTPLIAPVDAVLFKVVTYKGKEPVGRMLTMPIEVLKARAKM